MRERECVWVCAYTDPQDADSLLDCSIATFNPWDDSISDNLKRVGLVCIEHVAKREAQGGNQHSKQRLKLPQAVRFQQQEGKRIDSSDERLVDVKPGDDQKKKRRKRRKMRRRKEDTRRCKGVYRASIGQAIFVNGADMHRRARGVVALLLTPCQS